MLSPKEKIQIMQLEALREYYLSHAQAVSQHLGRSPLLAQLDYPLTPNDFEPLDTALRAHIKALKAFLTTTQAHSTRVQQYLAPVLLTKPGGDAGGISRKLSNYFGQLAGDGHEPFVQLTADSLLFYWHNSEDAVLFKQSLQAHGFIVQQSSQPVPNKTFPATADNTIAIAHRDIKKLLALAQYHPYEHALAIKQWYEAQQLDRNLCLMQEASKQTEAALPDSAMPACMTRLLYTHTVEETVVSVSLTAQPRPKEAAPHLIVIFDDSNSMSGAKIEAANQALQELVASLDNDTLITLQPLTQANIFYRRRAGDIKQSLKHIGCSGSTPLLEVLLGTGVFMKQRPSDLLCSPAEFKRAVVVALTDGQPNGGEGDTVEKLLNQMHQFDGSVDFAQENDRPTGMKQYQGHVSFGVQNFGCGEQPLIFGVAIGTEASQTFMTDLAHYFHTPPGFVRTDVNITADLQKVNAQVTTLLAGHAEPVLLGLTYQHKGEIKVATQEVQNLIYGMERDIFFTLPAGAEMLSCNVFSDNQFAHYTPDKFRLVTEASKQTATLINEWAREQLYQYRASLVAGEIAQQGAAAETPEAQLTKELQQRESDIAFCQKGLGDISAFKAQAEASKALRGGGGFHEYQNKDEAGITALLKQKQAEAITEQAHLQTELAELRAAAESSTADPKKAWLTHLMACPQDEGLVADIRLELQHLTNPQQTTAGYHSVTSAQGRFTAAQHVAQRFAKPVKKTALSTSALKRAIAAADIVAFTDALATTAEEINEEFSELEGTPLIFAIYRSSRASAESPHKGALTHIIQTLIEHPDIDLTAQDDNGNTALHKAAWYGIDTHCNHLITRAQQNGQITALRATRNQNRIGGTAGETPLDNIRLSPKLKSEQKQALIQQITDATRQPGGTDKVNCHSEPHWNTPLMNLLTTLRDKGDSAKQQHLRLEVQRFITTHAATIDFAAANFNGNTALHFALWNGEFAIAQQILQAAEAQGPGALTAVFAARNNIGETHTKTAHVDMHSGGEVPHMNLAARLEAAQAKLAAIEDCFQPFAKHLTENGPLLAVVLEIIQSQPKLRPILEKSETPADHHLLNQLVTAILARELETTILTLEYSALLQSFQQLSSELRAYFDVKEFFASHLTDSQLVESSHLEGVYLTQQQGYNPMNFLKDSPIIGLKNAYHRAERERESDESLGILADSLLEVLFNGAAIEDLQEWVEEELGRQKKPQAAPMGHLVTANAVDSSSPTLFATLAPQTLTTQLLTEVTRAISLFNYHKDAAASADTAPAAPC